MDAMDGSCAWISPIQHLDWFPLLDSNDNGVFLVNGNRWEVLGYSYKIKIGWCYSLGLSSATDLERKCNTWKISAILNVIIEGNLFPAQALSQTQKNVSELPDGSRNYNLIFDETLQLPIELPGPKWQEENAAMCTGLCMWRTYC